MEYLRIKKNTEFQKIFSKGKRGFSSHLTILFTPSTQLKMGICVGKKHGNSVTRNKIKRLLREIFRKYAENLDPNFSYVLVPKTQESYEYHTLEKCFVSIVKKQKLFAYKTDGEKEEERE